MDNISQHTDPKHQCKSVVNKLFASIDKYNIYTILLVAETLDIRESKAMGSDRVKGDVLLRQKGLGSIHRTSLITCVNKANAYQTIFVKHTCRYCTVYIRLRRK